MHPDALLLGPHSLDPQLLEGVELVDQAVVEEAIGEALDAGALVPLDRLFERVPLVGGRPRAGAGEVEVELDLELSNLDVDLAQLVLEAHGSSSRSLSS